MEIKTATGYGRYAAFWQIYIQAIPHISRRMSAAGYLNHVMPFIQSYWRGTQDKELPLH